LGSIQNCWKESVHLEALMEFTDHRVLAGLKDIQEQVKTMFNCKTEDVFNFELDRDEYYFQML